MNYKILIILAIVLLIIPITFGETAVIVLQGYNGTTDDSFTRVNAPDNNYESDHIMRVYDAAIYRNYITFALNQTALTCENFIDATLSLHDSGTDGTNDVAVYEINISDDTTAHWEENVITHNNAPCGTARPIVASANCNATPADTTTVTTDAIWWNWDISTIVGKALCKGNNNFSMLLDIPAGGSGDTTWLHSKETASPLLAPMVNITYDSTPPDFTAPTIKLGINNTIPNYNEDIYISFNATDVSNIITTNVTINWTTGTTIYNYTTAATSIELYNITTIRDIRGNVLNVSVCSLDALNNYGCISTTITISNSNPATPTILTPTLNDYNNNNIDFPFDITFPADNDGDEITIYYYIDGVFNSSSLTNMTYNTTDGYYILNVSLTDGIGWSENATVNFTIDTTLPTLLFFNLTNKTIFGYNLNATMNITIQDLNPYNLSYTFYNGSEVLQSGYNDVASSATTISIVATLNLTGLASGNYSLDINFSDRHTNVDINDYEIEDLPEGFVFKTVEGSEISISQFDGIKGDAPIVTKLKDRYTIDFGITKKRETKVFIVIADKEIKILRGKGYKGHLIIGKNWVDFENGDLESEVEVERVSWNIVLVSVYSYDFNFKSIGGLNIVEKTYNFQVDNHPPVVSSSINNSFPKQNEVVNISGSVNDLIASSTIFIGHNNSGPWVNATELTTSDGLTNEINLDYLLTITAGQGEIIGVMVCGNDTFNIFSCGEVHIIQVFDDTNPTIKTGNNATRFLRNQIINFTYNVTDNFQLDIGQVIIDENSEKKFYNFSLTGTTAEYSQNFSIIASAGSKINVTGLVNDTFGNIIQIETIFAVTKDLLVNATNIYDNTTILSFTATLFNTTYTETQHTSDGIINFDDIIQGDYDLYINTSENGGYFNVSVTDWSGRNDYEARMHQAVVYFTAVRRGTDVAILDYNITLPLAVNQSNATGGMRFLLNASDYTTSGAEEDYWDYQTNISLENQSTSNWVAEFYDINVSISIYAVANSSYLHNFTIKLDGTSFTETQTDVVGIDEGNLTFSLGNGTYDITVSHPEYSTAYFSFYIGSNDTFPNLTFSMLGLNSINFSVFDELTEQQLPENATINLISESFVGNFTANDGFLYVQDILPGGYRITYSSPTYTERDYYINILNDTNQSISLYLLSITNGTEIEFTVQDNSGTDLENATIRLKRYYISTNSYRTVAMSRTNTEGKAVIDVDFNDAFYETLTTFEDLTLRTVGTRFITTTMILTMNPITDPFTNVDSIDDMNTELSFNNYTETFSYVFTDTTGADATGTLTVIEITPTTETIICTTTDTTSSGTLLCPVNTTNLTGTFSAKGYIQVGSSNILTDTKSVYTGLVNDLKAVWGNQGVFFTILIAGSLGGLGMVVSPAVGIITFLTALVIVNFFGMSILSGTIYGFFVLVGIFIVWKMKR